MNNLFTKAIFLPVFHPKTQVLAFDINNPPTKGLLGNIHGEPVPPNGTSELLKTLSYKSAGITWQESVFAQPVPADDTIIKDFMEDTYTIINNMVDDINIGKYAAYCFKYGSLFKADNINIKSNTSVGLLVAFNNLKIIFDILNHSVDIHKFCRQIATAIKYEFTQTQQPIMAFVIFKTKDGIEEKHNSLEGYYIYPGMTLVSLRTGKPGRSSLPRLKFYCNQKDIILLNCGSEIEKTDWVKQQIVNSITNTIEQSNPKLSVKIKNDIPQISIIIDDRLLYFLFTLLSNNKGYNICPYCKKLLTNGNLYCNRNHMELYLKSTPIGKMSNMVNKWVQRGYLTAEQYTNFVEDGKELLNKYPYEKVKKLLQERKNNLWNGKESD